MHGLTATEYRSIYLDNVLVPPGDRRNVPDDIYHHLPGSHQGNGETLQASADRLVAAMIAVMLEVTAVYRVVSLSGIFIATGLVVLLVVTLIQTMDRHPRAGAGQAERGQGKPGLSDWSSHAS